MKNSRNWVFDTGILYLYFGGDRRAIELLRGIGKGTPNGFTCEPNVAELYYKTCEKLGRDTAMIRYTSLRHSSLVITAPDERLTLHAGELMCTYRNQLSLTDAYVISLAKDVHGHLFTTDPRIARLKIVPTEFLELK
ncbi:MAG: PIN domain-containing protein [Nitrososphaerales archaeon]